MPEDFESTALELARAAGERALEAFRRTIVLEFKGKKADNPVTALDRDTETFLRQSIRAAFPEHGLLGEEHADDIAEGARYVLVITGKGGASAGERGVLKRQVPMWLRLPEFRLHVLAVEDAHVSHGGEGALYVRVRRARGG